MGSHNKVVIIVVAEGKATGAGIEKTIDSVEGLYC